MDDREFIIKERNIEVYGDGYILLNRGIMKDSNIWRWEIDHPPKNKEMTKKGYTRLHAFCWLLFRARFEVGAIPFDDGYIRLEVGEILTSEKKLTDEFGWSKEKLRCFLKYLESVGEIEIRTINKGKGGTVLKMNNYQRTKTDIQTTKQTTTNLEKTEQSENKQTAKQTIEQGKKQTAKQTTNTPQYNNDYNKYTIIDNNNVCINGNNNGVTDFSTDEKTVMNFYDKRDIRDFSLEEKPPGKSGKRYGYYDSADDEMQYQNIWLTDDDYERMCSLYGMDLVNDAIENYSLNKETTEVATPYYADAKVLENYIKQTESWNDIPKPTEQQEKQPFYEGKYNNVSYSPDAYKTALKHLTKESNFRALIDKFSVELHKQGIGTEDITEKIFNFIDEVKRHPEKMIELVKMH